MSLVEAQLHLLQQAQQHAAATAAAGPTSAAADCESQPGSSAFADAMACQYKVDAHAQSAILCLHMRSAEAIQENRLASATRWEGRLSTSVSPNLHSLSNLALVTRDRGWYTCMTRWDETRG